MPCEVPINTLSLAMGEKTAQNNEDVIAAKLPNAHTKSMSNNMFESICVKFC